MPEPNSRMDRLLTNGGVYWELQQKERSEERHAKMLRCNRVDSVLRINICVMILEKH